jgi:ankyrin repeat protein
VEIHSFIHSFIRSFVLWFFRSFVRSWVVKIPLLAAVHANNEAAVDALLEIGCSPYSPMIVPPLHYAVHMGRPGHVVAKLLAAETNPSFRPDKKALSFIGTWREFLQPTPLLEACALGHADAVKVILAWRPSQSADEESGPTRPGLQLNSVREPNQPNAAATAAITKKRCI